VLAIGGLKEKVLAAHRAHIEKVILPEQNRKDMEDVPKEAQRDMKFVFVEDVRQVFKEALVPKTDQTDLSVEAPAVAAAAKEAPAKEAPASA
jgi:ATP-dependent Lon protease